MLLHLLSFTWQRKGNIFMCFIDTLDRSRHLDIPLRQAGHCPPLFIGLKVELWDITLNKRMSLFSLGLWAKIRSCKPHYRSHSQMSALKHLPSILTNFPVCRQIVFSLIIIKAQDQSLPLTMASSSDSQPVSQQPACFPKIDTQDGGMYSILRFFCHGPSH